MPIEVLGRLVTGGGSVEEAVARIHRDIEAGAPVNDDGTMNMVSYAAWLVKESGSVGSQTLSIHDTQLRVGAVISSGDGCEYEGVNDKTKVGKDIRGDFGGDDRGDDRGGDGD